MYYKKCPDCGANLDPGERCDCEQKAAPGGGTPRAATMQDHMELLNISTIILPQNKEEVNMKTREEMISEIVTNLPDLDNKSLEMAWYFITMPDTETEED